MRVFLVALLALSAGCAGAADGEAAQEAGGAAATEAPTWEVGRHWTYNTDGPGGAGGMTLAVTGSQGGDWILDTTDVGTAYFDALGDISFLGQIRQSDLAGSQGTDRIQFFDFPLEHNKTWSTRWDGEMMDIHVMHHMPNGNAHIMVHDSNGLYAEYEYDAQAMFFGYIQFYDENGTEAFRMELSESGTDFAGEALRYTLLDVQTAEASAFTPHQEKMAFGDANELQIVLHAFCNGDTQGQMFIGFNQTPPNEAAQVPPVPTVAEPAYGMSHDCATGDVGVDQFVFAIEPGSSWNLDMLAASQNGEVFVVVEPRILERITL